MIGRSGFSRYLGYLLRDDLVLLENIDYGNALYMMFDDWKTLSKRSRLDLLSDPTAHYERVLRDYLIKCVTGGFHYWLSPSGQRSAKVMANAFNAGFHRVIHRT